MKRYYQLVFFNKLIFDGVEIPKESASPWLVPWPIYYIGMQIAQYSLIGDLKNNDGYKMIKILTKVIHKSNKFRLLY